MKKDWKKTSPEEQGFHRVITRENSDVEYGEFYRINLGKGKEEKFTTESMEMGLCVIKGKVTIDVSGKNFVLKKFDSVYAPCEATVTITGQAEANIIYIGVAPSKINIDPYKTLYDPNLHVGERRQVHGQGRGRRDVYMCIGPQDQAYRLIMGLTWGGDGQWTSWPPHQHSDYLEEIYCYFNMDYPRFGFHFSFQDLDEVVSHRVSSSDAVIAPYGYHPTVASPGTSNSYLWILSAKDPAEKNRRYDLARFYPGLGKNTI